MIKNSQLFPGKIAIITDHPAVNEDDFHSADRLIEKYGADKIVHVTWPEDFIAERGKMIDTVAALAEDSDIRALIISQAVLGTNAAVDKLKETRDDVFVVYCSNVQESTPESSTRADLLFTPNHLGMGSAMVEQARKQGAKVFVHYSFPRHMTHTMLSARRDLARQECLKMDILFVDAEALDPTDEAGLGAAQQFIKEDVPKMVAKYGENTAFFATNCHLQTTLIKAVIDCHAIYPQPCCPSPMHGFPEALGIETKKGTDDLNYVIGEACRIAEEKNMTDRLSTWPVSASMMFTSAGTEYAIMWMKGAVSETRIDNNVLMDCMRAYVIDVIGEASNVYMESCTENGITYDNFKLILMSYLDF